jgi:ribosomal protein S27AE
MKGRTNADGTKDFPFDEVCKSVKAQLKKDPNIRFFQKWTCVKCGQRLTLPEPNKFVDRGSCDQCGYITNIKERGCNHAMIMSSDVKKFDELVARINKNEEGK